MGTYLDKKNIAMETHKKAVDIWSQTDVSSGCKKLKSSGRPLRGLPYKILIPRVIKGIE